MILKSLKWIPRQISVSLMIFVLDYGSQCDKYDLCSTKYIALGKNTSCAALELENLNYNEI